MNITEFVSNHLFNKGTNILIDGATSEKVKDALSGLESALKGLSEAETKSLFEDTSPFKSYVDKRTTDGVKTREDKLTSEFETEKRKFAEETTKLKSRIPQSEDPSELRKQALDESDINARRMLEMRADNIEIKNQLAESTASDAKKLQELTRERLLNIARSELGERHLPKSISDNLQMFIGSDEETTKGKMANFNTEWDNLTKDIKTSGINPDTPPGSGEPVKEGEDKMNERMGSMSFLD